VTRLRDKNSEPFVLAEVPAAGLPPLDPEPQGPPAPSARERRMLRLASAALAECLAPLAKLGRLSPPPPLCLALPEKETMRPVDRPAFLHRLATQVAGAFDPARSDVSHTGRAGALVAVGQATLAVQQRFADFVLAGGIDTYRDAYVLGTLDMESRVKSRANLDGFVPGEAAGFVLLAAPAGSRRGAWRSCGRAGRPGSPPAPAGRVPRPARRRST